MNLSFAKLFYPLASCLFMLILLLPLADQFFHISGEAANTEQRNLATFPVLKKDSVTLFPKGFDAYYNDNFGFRQPLISLGSKIKYRVFSSSPTPAKVSVGKDNWLFLTGRFYEITQDLVRENLYIADTLKRHAAVWAGRKQELAARHVQYYKAFWPDKYYIYPEYMSYWMQRVNRDTIAKCDQAINYLKQTQSPLQIIDVRSDLQEAKKENIKIYHKSDSHWNNYGAFIAYTHLMNVIAKDIPALSPVPLSAFTVSWTQTPWPGDLTALINIFENETEPVFTRKNYTPRTQKVSAEGYPKKTQVYVNDSASTKLRALVYRDSYTAAMIPFLSMHFSEIVFIWDTSYSLEMVEKVKPDVVIECYASRYFR